MDDIKNYYGILCKYFKCDKHNILEPVRIVKCQYINHNVYSYEHQLATLIDGDVAPKDIENEDYILYDIISEDALTFDHTALNVAVDKYFANAFNSLYIQSFNNSTKKYEIHKFNYENNNILQFNEVNEVKENKNNYFELYSKLKNKIIGQDQVIKDILTIMDFNQCVKDYRNKYNMLLIGPSGSGKTEIFRRIQEFTDAPITIEDAEQYTAAGYKGADIEEMLLHLYINAGCDLEKAQNGVLVVDEVDKKLTSDKDDPGGKRVITGLLKLMEGTKFYINPEHNDNINNSIVFDTTNLTVILAGAFCDLVQTKNNHIGYNSDTSSIISYKDIDTNKLNKYGLSNEALRRVYILKARELSISDLEQIIKNPQTSVLEELKSYLKSKNVNLNIDEAAIKVMAMDAYNMHLGASGIKNTTFEIMLSAMSEIGLHPDKYSELNITGETIKKEPPYTLVKKKIN